MIALVLPGVLPGEIPQLLRPVAVGVGVFLADPAHLERLAVLAEHAAPAEFSSS